jgi:hypothetical protein
LGLRQIERNSPSEPIGLAKIEGGVGIAFLRKRSPDCDGPRGVAFLPGFDPGAHRLARRRHRQASNRKDKQQLTHIHTPKRTFLTLAPLRSGEQGRAHINQFLGALLSGGINSEVSA